MLLGRTPIFWLRAPGRRCSLLAFGTRAVLTIRGQCAASGDDGPIGRSIQPRSPCRSRRP
ncbi:MAG: hypothetical protein QJR07_12850 [Acetobacteraceae bacterium]|nr:hypothetical protein [Acetobacteraceae bacterium]